MKQNRYIWAMLSVLVMGMSSCDKHEPIPENSGIISEADADALSVTMSIADLKATYDVKDELFSINYIESDTTLYVRGRVITSDESGNIYKYMIIQDTETGEGLKVSVDAGSLSGAFPMGQEIVINCKGLVLGRYASMAQLGVETYNYSKGRIEPGRIPIGDFMSRVKFVGKPDTSKIICPVITIEELNSRVNDASIYAQLVRINGVHFTGKGDAGEKLSEADKIFAPSTYSPTLQYNIGYPQSREIADIYGNVAYLSTSEYARFADVAIPAEDAWGDVIAIVSYYRDKEERDGELQLTIRSLDDLPGFFDGTGTKPTPDTPEVPEGDVIFSETFATSIDNFTADNKVLGDGLSFVWSYDSKYSCAKASAYKGGAVESESWLISPTIAMNGKEGTLTFEHAANYIGDAATEMTLYYTADDGKTWEQLAIPTYPTNWDFVSSGAIALPAADSVKIAFVYKSTSSNACTWEIKNVSVMQSNN